LPSLIGEKSLLRTGIFPNVTGAITGASAE